jgi:transcriptional regulator with XRE-family HTH domain
MTSNMPGILREANTIEQAQYRPPSIKDDGKVCPDGATIRRMRKQRGYSRDRLAELTGVAIKTLRMIETRPFYRCRPCTIGILAQHFGVEPSAFILPEDCTDMRLLTSIPEILQAKSKIITSAKSVLACVGSRSRHESLLRLIESTLETKPGLVHYRTMSLPPFKKEFQNHLLKILKIREARQIPLEHKTLHIGIHDCLISHSESHILVNETTALVMLPCVAGIGSRSTAVLLEDADIAQKYIGLIEALYRSGRIIETEQDVLDLGLVNEQGHRITCQ